MARWTYDERLCLTPRNTILPTESMTRLTGVIPALALVGGQIRSRHTLPELTVATPVGWWNALVDKLRMSWQREITSDTAVVSDAALLLQGDVKSDPFHLHSLFTLCAYVTYRHNRVAQKSKPLSLNRIKTANKTKFFINFVYKMSKRI